MTEGECRLEAMRLAVQLVASSPSTSPSSAFGLADEIFEWINADTQGHGGIIESTISKTIDADWMGRT